MYHLAQNKDNILSDKRFNNKGVLLLTNKPKEFINLNKIDFESDLQSIHLFGYKCGVLPIFIYPIYHISPLSNVKPTNILKVANMDFKSKFLL